MGADRKFRIVTYQSKRQPTPAPLVLDHLVDLYTLLQHEEVDCVMPDGTPGCRGKVTSKQEPCPQKDGFAWSPGFVPAGRERSNKAVESLDFAVFDIDGIDWQQLESIVSKIAGLEAFIHSTHTHLDPNVDRSAAREHRPQRNVNVRLVLPFTRSVTPAEWKSLWPAIDRKFGLNADKGTKDPSRLSFFPRALRGRPYLNERQEGVLLDPGPLLLGHAIYSHEVLSQRGGSGGPAPEPGTIDLNELRKHLRAYSAPNDPDGEKEALVKRLVEGEAFAFKGSRGKSTTIVGGIVGKLMPHGTPVEAVLELLRPSLAAAVDVDDGPGDGIEPWSERIANYYQLAQEEKDTELAAEQDAVGKLHAALKKRREAAASAPATATVLPFTPLPKPLDPPPVSNVVALAAAVPVPALALAPNEDEHAWRLDLFCTENKKGILIPRNVGPNAAVVLEKHPAWKNVLRYNEITNEPEVHGGPLVVGEREPERLITAIQIWLLRHEQLELAYATVEQFVEYVSRANRYDPVSAYLLGLKWDGTPRLNDWLIRYGKARLVDENGLDVENYVKTVGRRWLMAAVARGLHPGCKADSVLVLEGNQDVGKSTMLDILGGQWFADTKLNLGDKSTLELTSKSWIIEMSELAAMKKSETESQKGFFSTKVDNFRLSYARRVRPYKRRCVFAGTTNEKNYLIDPTGNRRFWTVWLDQSDLFSLRKDRDQLWAEAAACVLGGEQCPNCFGLEDRCATHRWWMDPEETAFNEQVTQSRLRGNFNEAIYDWWINSGEHKVKTDSGKYIDAVGTNDIMAALDLKVDQTDRHAVPIGLAMKVLGFQRTRATINQQRRWVYEATEKLLTARRAHVEARRAPRESAPPGPKHDRSSLLHLIAKAPEAT